MGVGRTWLGGVLPWYSVYLSDGWGRGDLGSEVK